MKNLLSTIVLANGLLLGASALAAQTCSGDLTRPDSRYTDHHNGTVTDKKTDLMWQTCSVGQTYDAGACTGAATPYNWPNALASAQTANNDKELGYADWRVPSIAELRTLVERSCATPAINETVFPSTADNAYWSSSASVNAGAKDQAWLVFFTDKNADISGNDGYVTKWFARYVRLVRGGH